MHHVPPVAARPHIHLEDRVGDAVRPVKLREMKGIGDQPEDQRPRRVEDALDDDDGLSVVTMEEVTCFSLLRA
jgi:hypothetical protein